MDLYHNAFKKLYQSVGQDRRIVDIPEKINDINQFLLSKYNPNSHSMVVRSLRQAWSLGIRSGIIEGINPFQLISTTKERKTPQIWTPDQMDTIYSVIDDPEIQKAFILARFSALRRYEISRNVRWEKIHIDRRMGYLPDAKTGEDQPFPIFWQ
ncbi:hypothetical protein A2Y85_04105 [candidate division WOR-3 bacterium RBG_13_43_14]|uniref:Tyr recombinase domain-containing protein n=1 Tax=candidate division WOR-3 bacterium RBG_13_43_14 TaxID=1802590 RepID=A0A1F4U9Z6_UNCW3|nr:MAG: hypothetical protein A2Y85_04105 [candidate division WOR-3 bacterium RBG_13_43_14]